MKIGDISVDLTVDSGQFRKALIEPLLGLATTRQLLEELKARGEVAGTPMGRTLATRAGQLLDLPPSMLDYRTVNS